MTNFIDPIALCRLEDRNNPGRFIDFSPNRASYDVGRTQGSVSLPYMKTLTVTTRLGTSNDISLGLEVPALNFEAFMGAWFDLFTPGQTLKVQFGFSSGNFLTREFSATVIGLPSATFQPDSVVLSVEGKGSLWFSSRNERSLNANGRTIYELIVDICAAYGTVVYYVDASTGDERPLNDGNVRFASRMGVRLNEVFKDNEFMLIKDLISVRAQLGFYINGNRIVVFDPTEQRVNNRSEWRFEYRKARIDIDSGIMPIIGPSVKNSGLAFAKGTGALGAKDIDLESGAETAEDVITRNDPRVNVVHLRPGVRDDSLGGSSQVFGDRSGTTSVQPTLSKSDPSYDAKLAYLKARAEDVSGSSMTWQTLPLPTILPGHIAHVSGLSFLYDGRYQISELTYSYGGQGLDLSISAYSPGQAPAQTDILTDIPQRLVSSSVPSEPNTRATLDATTNAVTNPGELAVKSIDGVIR